MDSYDPLTPPDPAAWLALDETDRMGLVQIFVDDNEPGIEGEMLHVLAHVLTENQIALGEETPVKAAHERLMREGLDRHEAVHAIGSAFMEMIWTKGGIPTEGAEEDYFARVESLTAEKWRALGMDDDVFLGNALDGSMGFDEPPLMWDPDELVDAIERHIYEEDKRARGELGLSSVTDANVKSAIRKAMGLLKGRPPKSPPKDPKEAWIASLATGIDRILQDCIGAGVPRHEAADALKAVESSLKTRREMNDGSRAYLDFLTRFVENGELY